MKTLVITTLIIPVSININSVTSNIVLLQRSSTKQQRKIQQELEINNSNLPILLCGQVAVNFLQEIRVEAK